MSNIGKSVIDLVWVNESALELVENFNVAMLPVQSDHFPVTLNLILRDSKFDFQAEKIILRWNPKRFNIFYDNMLFSPNVSKITDNINLMHENLINTIRSVAQQAGMIVGGKNKKSSSNSSLWENLESKKAKENMKNMLKICYANEFMQEYASSYIESKKEYKKIKKKCKEEYENKIIKKIIGAKSSNEFWEGVNYKRKRYKKSSCPISLKQWHEVYNKFYTENKKHSVDIIIQEHFENGYVEELDKDITLEELNKALDKCKCKKAPGEDEITYEFFKALPENWLYYLVIMLNKIMNLELTPDEWSKIIIKMLYKNKGDKLDVDSYRPLALANCSAKVFTMILYSRTADWCEKNQKIPKWQAGFRKDFSCLDNIFTLNALIGLKLKKEKGKLYALFIDFKGAFNSVDHELLWKKLRKIGLSSRFINILRSIYSKAKIKISDNLDYSEMIEFTIGVLQGEILSPLLFAIFLFDLEEFLRSKGIRGVSASHLIDILLLAYADDIVILADTYIIMKNILVLFHEYCTKNKLIVNINKTKMILFQKGGHAHKFRKSLFYYGIEQVEYVKKYTYLGIIFSQTGSFEIATEQFVSKAKIASASLSKLIYSLKVNSFEIYCKLFEALVESIIVYGSPVYAVQNLEQIEKIQIQFFKNLLRLPHSTPGYAVRLETGVSHVSLKIFKNTINWIVKVLSMPEDRYPKVCLMKLLSCMKSDKNKSK